METKTSTITNRADTDQTPHLRQVAGLGLHCLPCDMVLFLMKRLIYAEKCLVFNPSLASHIFVDVHTMKSRIQKDAYLYCLTLKIFSFIKLIKSSV